MESERNEAAHTRRRAELWQPGKEDGEYDPKRHRDSTPDSHVASELTAGARQVMAAYSQAPATGPNRNFPANSSGRLSGKLATFADLTILIRMPLANAPDPACTGR